MERKATNEGDIAIADESYSEVQLVKQHRLQLRNLHSRIGDIKYFRFLKTKNRKRVNEWMELSKEMKLELGKILPWGTTKLQNFILFFEKFQSSLGGKYFASLGKEMTYITRT